MIACVASACSRTPSDSGTAQKRQVTTSYSPRVALPGETQTPVTGAITADGTLTKTGVGTLNLNSTALQLPSLLGCQKLHTYARIGVSQRPAG